MPESPSDRLRQARKRAGFETAAAFAAKFDLTESTYRSAENGSRGLRLPAAKRYAPLLGVTWQWLMEGGPVQNVDRAAPAPGLTEHEINIPNMPRDVPILGGGLCGEDGLFELNGQTLDHARRPPRLAGVKDAYALFVHGDSMSPWREPGQLVYVHPHQPVNVSDYVVVQLHSEGPGHAPAAYIKKLVRRSASTLRLTQFNPREDLSIATARVKAIHRVIDWSELMGL